MSENPPCPKCGKPLSIGRACPGFVPFAFCIPPLSAKEMERQVEKRTDRCRYFTGIFHNPKCAAGVAYNSFGPPQPYRTELPCFAKDGNAGKCAKREAPSETEARRELEAMHSGCGFSASGDEVVALVSGTVVGGSETQGEGEPGASR